MVRKIYAVTADIRALRTILRNRDLPIGYPQACPGLMCQLESNRAFTVKATIGLAAACAIPPKCGLEEI